MAGPTNVTGAADGEPSARKERIYELLCGWFGAQADEQSVGLEVAVIDVGGAAVHSRLAELDGDFDLDALASHIDGGLDRKED